ncbi:bifunctional polynucleotide phosphatase/kinase [Achlya hypogyna]|uniref:Bifunctional polynucleotide phosphatase/kinase n=1 Tax=Achlya hypogyna TaxID=1202772 RepID=A0A1V9YPP6_ACHHY|nr:bifunctional polynucleotide phosphatase/kinase [Achlya hypogyna]
MDKFVTKAFLANKALSLVPAKLSKKQVDVLVAKITEAGGKVVDVADADIVVAAKAPPSLGDHQSHVSVEWLQDCLAQKKLLPLPSRKRASSLTSAEAPMAKKAKATTGAITWAKAGSIIYCSNVIATPASNAPVKIAAFDMDSTLITTKSGKTFAVNDDDWKLWHESVPTKLRSLLDDDGYVLVVFSNQSGLSKGKVTEKGLKGKIEAIMTKLQLPLRFYLLPENDINRKPRTGAWDFMVQEYGWTVDMAASFYCGDAAGRPKGLDHPVATRNASAIATGKAKKDFSAGDYKFALNVGVSFQTPEQLFLGSKLSLHCDTSLRDLGFDPRSLLTDARAFEPEPASNPEMVVLVGSPAAGKSTFCATYFGTYARINQDTLKTPAKCKQACLERLEAGDSVVIDNTNRDTKSRKEWIELARKQVCNLAVAKAATVGVAVRCFYLDLPKPLVFHLNAFRALQKQLHPEAAEHKSDVPDMVIHGFFKNMVVPTVDEGFSSVVHVPFARLSNLDAAAAKLLTSFLL